MPFVLSPRVIVNVCPAILFRGFICQQRDVSDVDSTTSHRSSSSSRFAIIISDVMSATSRLSVHNHHQHHLPVSPSRTSSIACTSVGGPGVESSTYNVMRNMTPDNGRFFGVSFARLRRDYRSTDTCRINVMPIGECTEEERRKKLVISLTIISHFAVHFSFIQFPRSVLFCTCPYVRMSTGDEKEEEFRY